MTRPFKWLAQAGTMVLLVSFALAGTSTQPQRSHLTDQEIEAIRLNQELDKRIGVFIKAADRRFLVLTDPAGAASKISKKENDLYGPLPEGTRAQLLDDVTAILDESIDKIDDVAAHDEKSPLLMKSLKNLSQAAVRFSQQLRSLGAATRDTNERMAAERAAEKAQEIIDAAKQHGI